MHTLQYTGVTYSFSCSQLLIAISFYVLPSILIYYWQGDDDVKPSPFDYSATVPRRSLCTNSHVRLTYDTAKTFWFYLLIRVINSITLGEKKGLQTRTFCSFLYFQNLDKMQWETPRAFTTFKEPVSIIAIPLGGQLLIHALPPLPPSWILFIVFTLAYSYMW